MDWDDTTKTAFVQTLDSYELNLLKEEINLCIDNIGGNLKISESVEILFSDMKEDILGFNKTKYKRMLGDFKNRFNDLISEFKSYCQVNERSVSFNIYLQIGQYERFLNFVEILRKFDLNRADIDIINHYRECVKNIEQIRDFIFSNDPWLSPNEHWSRDFFKILGFGKRIRLGFELYYAKAIGELIRTIRNQYEHKKKLEFHDELLDDKFHDGFIQIYSCYILMCYSFLELIKYWEINNDFLDKLLNGEIL
jgi:hypothetical protein